jgi:predicted amidohydrolase
MKIAAAQISCVTGNPSVNVDKVRDFAARAQKRGAELIVFPEMTDTGYSMPAIQKHATTWDEGAVPEIQKIAKELSLAIVCGVSERQDDLIYNAQVFIDIGGNIIAKYRKTHLVTAAPLDERPVFTAGDEFVSARIDPFKAGLLICYDLRFPEVCRNLAIEQNTNLFVVSSAWPWLRIEHLRAFALSRAIENQSYLIVANRVGIDDGVTLCGTSAIIDPHGAILAAASVDREELIYADISREVVDLVRERIRVFDQRRPDLY